MDQRDTLRSEKTMEQERLLEMKKAEVARHGFFAKKGMDNGDIKLALKHASTMCAELRTSRLSPSNYYDLYMSVADELRKFESALSYEVFTNPEEKDQISLVDLHETVQHCGTILPRSYLLITVSSVFIKTQEIPVREILSDLLELVRGVQNPLRGLFLRDFLTKMMKDKLPDKGTPFNGPGGSLNDAYEFILNNFTEMNKLWVRLQHQGMVMDRGHREQQRKHLRMLVGTNIERISQLTGLDLKLYSETILPRLLEQVINCKDGIAQEYLTDIITAVFPDEYHLATLDIFLNACAQLDKGVPVHEIITRLIKRLKTYCSNISDDDEETIKKKQDSEIFKILHRHCSKIGHSFAGIKLADIIYLQSALASFAGQVYPDELDYIDNVLSSTTDYLVQRGNELDDDITQQLLILLRSPLPKCKRILVLQSYPRVMDRLNPRARASLAESIVNAFVSDDTVFIDTVDEIEKFLLFIKPLLIDGEGVQDIPDSGTGESRSQFESRQHLVARFIHKMYSKDTDEHFKICMAAGKYFRKGGRDRIRYTLPALIFEAIKLARRTFDRETKTLIESERPQVPAQKILHFILEVVRFLARQGHADLSLRLSLEAAICGDYCQSEESVYDLVEQALVEYEEEIADGTAQFQAIILIIGCIQKLKILTGENYETLSQKAAVHSSKLLKKIDKCYAVCACAHLFWVKSTCSSNDNELDTERREDENMGIQVDFISNLIALIEEHFPNLTDDAETVVIAKSHYKNTIKHIQLMQQNKTPLGLRYQNIKLSQ